jgi:hypothetical protein
MKKTRLIQALILGIVMLTTNRCTKDGATGPQGPQGPTGNANVISATFTMSSWLYSSPFFYGNLSIPEITSANANSAAVMVYFNTGNATSWVALPYTQYNSPSDYYMGFNTSAGNIQITWVYDSSISSGSDPNTFYGTTVNYKVVVIPPAMMKPNVNHHNYAEVKVAYNLKD